jgi:hypothetical protein
MSTKLSLPEDGQDIWPKHVADVYNKYENIVQVVGGGICRVRQKYLTIFKLQ